MTGPLTRENEDTCAFSGRSLYWLRVREAKTSTAKTGVDDRRDVAWPAAMAAGRESEPEL